MSSSNGLDRAARRRTANNTPVPSGLGAAEDGLAKVIGESVALHLAQLLAQILPQLAPQATACLFCAVDAKRAQAAHAVAVENAKKATEPEPEAPPLNIQQAFTSAPVALAPGQPPVSCPVCFDHLQAGPQARQVGLVLPDGRPIVAQG